MIKQLRQIKESLKEKRKKEVVWSFSSLIKLLSYFQKKKKAWKTQIIETKTRTHALCHLMAYVEHNRFYRGPQSYRVWPRRSRKKIIKTTTHKIFTNTEDSINEPILKVLVDKCSNLSFLSFTYWSNAASIHSLFISKQYCRPKHRASTTASSRAAEPPCPRNGPITCMASLATVTVPFRKPWNNKSHGGRYFVPIRLESVSWVRCSCLTIFLMGTQLGFPRLSVWFDLGP